MQSVQVLMSTYNGVRYLSQQIDSILSQQGVSVSVLIRDDGSADGTLDMLRDYERKNQNITVYAGKNIGAAESFYDLLQNADMSGGYYAFSDQDDVWQAGKLQHAIRLLERQREISGAYAADPMQDCPLLYAGKVIYASADLSRREAYPYRINRKPSFGNALIENICMGCTEVFNRPLLELVRRHVPSGRMMHDWWMYLTASCFGKVVFDQTAYMLYRQHADNQVGMQNCWSRRWMHRLRNAGKLGKQISIQALEFRKCYAGLLADNHELNLVCSCRDSMAARIRLVQDKKIYRQNTADDVVFRLLFLIGYL